MDYFCIIICSLHIEMIKSCTKIQKHLLCGRLLNKNPAVEKSCVKRTLLTWIYQHIYLRPASMCDIQPIIVRCVPSAVRCGNYKLFYLSTNNIGAHIRSRRLLFSSKSLYICLFYLRFDPALFEVRSPFSFRPEQMFRHASGIKVIWGIRRFALWALWSFR